MSRPSQARTVVEALTETGGTAAHDELVALTSRSALRSALVAGVVCRLGRSVYVLPDVAAARPVERSWTQPHEPPSDAEILALARDRALARSHGAVLARLSAAAQYGWPVRRPAQTLDLLVPESRRLRPAPGTRMQRSATTRSEREEGVTSPERTVLDCAHALAFPEALAVADSALRLETVGPEGLRKAAEARHGPYRARVRRVVEAADGRSANPFESVLRAHTFDVPGFHPIPQYEIEDGAFRARVDLADPALRIVVEGDSYRYHGARDDFDRDVERYTNLVERDWSVLRYTVAEVETPRRVVDTLSAVVDLRRR